MIYHIYIYLSLSCVIYLEDSNGQKFDTLSNDRLRKKLFSFIFRELLDKNVLSTTWHKTYYMSEYMSENNHSFSHTMCVNN